MRYFVKLGNQQFSLNEVDLKKGTAHLDGRLVSFDFQHVRGTLYSLIVDGRVFSAHLSSDGSGEEIVYGPHVLRAEVEDERAALLRQLARGEAPATGTLEIKAPMPGLVVRLLVKKDDIVIKGQSVAVIEAMKMENDIKSPAGGVVTAVHVAERNAVEKNAKLITLTADT